MVNTIEKERSVVGGPDQPEDILRDGEELAECWGKGILGRGHDKFKGPEEHSCKGPENKCKGLEAEIGDQCGCSKRTGGKGCGL